MNKHANSTKSLTYIECDDSLSKSSTNQSIVFGIDQQIEIDDDIGLLVRGNILDFDRFQTDTLIFTHFDGQQVFESLLELSTDLELMLLEFNCF